MRGLGVVEGPFPLRFLNARAIRLPDDGVFVSFEFLATDEPVSSLDSPLCESDPLE